MAPRLRNAVVRFDVLPEPVLRVIMLALPVDARARAACVCRSWRAVLADVSLWQVLDLTSAGGVAAARVTENLVRGAVARAGGHLRELSLNRVPALNVAQMLIAVIESDGTGAELEQLNTDARLDVAELTSLFAAAPRLQVLNAQVIDYCRALLPVVRNDPPYGPLRVSELEVNYTIEEVAGEEVAEADVLALAAAVAAHKSLKGLSIMDFEFARGVNALVDAAAERRVSSLTMLDSDTDAESVPALARLLQRGSLTELEISCDSGFPDAQEASVLCAALRACPTLTHLSISVNTFNPVGGANRGTVTELLDAAAALPALSELDMSYSTFQDPASAGRALGALLGANLPSVRKLNVCGCVLGDVGLAPLLDGLAANTHLRELDCQNNHLSVAFKRDRLRPALAALATRAALDA
jgi:hypothetical protein